MKVNEEIIKSCFNKNALDIGYTSEEFALIDMIRARDSKLADECERLIIRICSKTKYRAFEVGFKQGIKYKKYPHKH